MIPMQKVISSSQGTRVLHRKASLRPESDLLTRTSWADAALALAQVRKGKAQGNKCALWIRSWLQKRLFLLGCFIQRNPGKIIFVGLLVLSCFCVGLKSATMETDVEKLWVNDGGRLEKELKYIKKTLGEGVGSTNQILIHTPREEGSNVLHPDTLLTHLQVLKAAIQVSVEVFDIPWSLKDLCYSPSFPYFEKHYIDMPLENLFPCAIITPLDCFWEGSKLLGPEYPVKIPGLNMNVQWTNLNPQYLINTVKRFGTNYMSSFPLLKIETFMKRAGISSAYQEKPCLLPSDEQCPTSAPNKKSFQPVDIGATLTGGCYGFATKYMHWPEDVIVGGVTKNKTGHIVRYALLLQTIIQLMAEKEMYEFWQDHIKVHNLDWTVEKAKKVLEAWQRKFTEAVYKESQSQNVSRRNSINAFSTTSLGDIMKDFSEMSVTRVVAGYVAMLVYVFFCLMNCYDPVKSQSGIGIAGVVLVALSVAAGLGFCALLGIVFNAATTQVLPFLASGLGMNNMFLIAHQYALSAKSESNYKELLTGEVLKRTGVNISLTSFCSICAFFSATIIPIPALRTFAQQAAILVLFNAAAILLIFPAVVSIDSKRRKYKLIDILCCFKGDLTEQDKEQMQGLRHSQSCPSVVVPIRQAVTHALPPDGGHVVTVLAPSANRQSTRWQTTATPNPSVENLTSSTNTPETKETPTKEKIREKYLKVIHNKSYLKWSLLSWFVSSYLAPTLQKTPTKFLTVVSCIIMICIGVWGIFHVKDGLDLTDIVPRNTNEYQFLQQRAKYFGFFNMFAVTQGNFEYPTNQRLLYDYHDSFTRIEKIIKNDNGGLPDFWLTIFRDWLLALQKSFDFHWKSNCINQEGWCSNATEDSILAYKLIVQTGRIDNPVDKSLVNSVRLVDQNGIINPKAFYNYLTAWVSNDALAYSASQANFVPEPRRWVHDPLDVELKMPKSQPLVYAQIPFFLNKMGSTEDITETIREIRIVCEKFRERGLPNFPTGLPFTYWEQYLSLRYYLWLSILCIFVVIFFVIAILLFSFWAGIVVVFLLAVILIELFGFMGIMGIKLSAVPAVILIASVGIGLEFAAHILMGFLTSIGDRERRMVMTLEQMFSPVVHGAMSTLIGVVMLAFSEFDFIFRYFFTVLCALVILGLLNGFVLFPVILSVVGPPGEVIPLNDSDRIPTPSPEPSPIRQRMKHARPFGRRIYPRLASEISLSTITEESSSCHSSHEIIVQPEVVVETTTVTNTSNGSTTVNTSTNTPENTDSQSDDSSKCNTPNGENVSTTTTTNTSTSFGPHPSVTTQTAVTTRVTATAKVKVEVHAPLLSSLDSSRHRRRRDSSSSRSSSARSSPT
ncbi:LOW QUALITY PROTEIN: protein patched homolog 1-like [Uloborus diversus]|uniref:LOW QUALITY PROTEIN: protein patched homolog 1-like n=1 Tax=Uloborus diversus TaxID=327109 RepID=UPI00240A2C71|nr:LOW QUALITY PROTEIN: protein patched homolog 1-like [Uloborus diversus]